jgi:penicillin amidase
MTIQADNSIPLHPPGSSPASGPSRAVRRLGTAFYVSGLIGLVAFVLLLWFGDRIRYEPPPDRARLPGLVADVEVVWDGSGTYHLRGESWEDVLTGQGWLHARDRLWQMEVGRLVASGRLAELVGREGLPIDRVFRTIGLDAAARRQVAALPAETRNRLSAYATGVNAWLGSDHYRPPPEFVMLGWDPAPWSLEDSALMIGLTALTLSGNWAQEAVRAALESEFSPEDVAILLPDIDEGPFVTGVADGTGERRSDNAIWTEFARATFAFRELAGIRRFGLGSNAWVVSGLRSASGGPLLANDPHLNLQIPSLLISNGLHFGERNLVGVSLPGVPGIVLGRTDAFAWAFTNGMADNQDLYLERVVDGDPDRYWYAGATELFHTRIETLRERWGSTELLPVRTSRHGPVINGVLQRLLHLEEDVSERAHESSAGGAEDRSGSAAEWARKAQPIALRWSALESGGELLAVDMLLDARSLDAARAALRHFSSPPQNVLMADTSGTIAYQFTGQIPRRQGWDGSHPVAGWTGEYEWDGFLTPDELPRAENPPDGILVSANNRPRAPGDGPYLGRWWIPPHRASRIEELLLAESKHTLATFEAIQRDVVSLGARGIVSDLAELGASGSQGERALAILEGWEGAIEVSGPSALYESFMGTFFTHLLLDELGREGLRDYLSLLDDVDGRYPVVRRLLGTPEASWWDDTRTPVAEDRDTIVERIWRDTLRQLEQRFGPDPLNWRWGVLHALDFRHPLERFGPLTGLVNRGPFEMAGDNDTIYNSHYLLTDRYRTQAVSAWRHLVELSPPVRGRQILSTGNGGHFLSPFYDDQTADWLAGITRPASTRWEEAQEAATRRMRLIP